METERIREAWRAAREQWPEIDVPEDDFASYVLERVEDSHASPSWSDLYLACACARRDPQALRAFDAVLFPQIEPALARVARSVSSDEVRQILRDKLFVAEPGKRPKIADYSGRGALRTWLRITAMRVALGRTGHRRGLDLPGGRCSGTVWTGRGEVRAARVGVLGLELQQRQWRWRWR